MTRVETQTIQPLWADLNAMSDSALDINKNRVPAVLDA